MSSASSCGEGPGKPVYRRLFLLSFPTPRRTQTYSFEGLRPNPCQVSCCQTKSTAARQQHGAGHRGRAYCRAAGQGRRLGFRVMTLLREQYWSGGEHVPVPGTTWVLRCPWLWRGGLTYWSAFRDRLRGPRRCPPTVGGRFRP